MRLGPHTIDVVRAGTKPADYGTGTQTDWSSSSTTAVDGCSVQPASSDEFTIDQDTFTTRLVAYVPAGADVRAADRIVWNGETYDIDGDVLRWEFSGLSHIVINLSRSAVA